MKNLLANLKSKLQIEESRKSYCRKLELLSTDLQYQLKIKTEEVLFLKEKLNQLNVLMTEKQKDMAYVPIRKIESLLDTFSLEKKKIFSESIYQTVFWLIQTPVKVLFDSLEAHLVALLSLQGKSAQTEQMGEDLQIDFRLLGPLNQFFKYAIQMITGILDEFKLVSFGLSSQQELLIFELIFDGSYAVRDSNLEIDEFSENLNNFLSKKFGSEAKLFFQSGKKVHLTISIPSKILTKKLESIYFLPNDKAAPISVENLLGIHLLEMLTPLADSQYSAVIVTHDQIQKATSQFGVPLHKLVCIGQAPSETLVTSILDPQRLRHFVDSTNSFSHIYLDSCLKKINKQGPSGLEDYLFPGSPIYSKSLFAHVHKKKLLESINSFAQGIKAFRGLAEIVTMIADEMIMNGMFDAPRDEKGEERYNRLPRTHPLVLEPHETIQVKYGADSHFIGVSIRDPFGALTYETLLSYLRRCYSRGTNQINQKTGGAGLGLFTIFDHSHCLIINSIPGKKTEIIALIGLSVSFARYQATHKSLSFFIEN